MKARLFFGLLLAMLIAGCGSQDNDVNLATGGGSTFVRKPLAGKLFLGAPIADVPVSVQTLDGNVLETQATDETGNFLFEGPLPVNFRLVATLDPENVFAREVRDFGPGETYYAAITVPTTLVSMLSQATPGASIDELEQKARQILKIPGKGPLTAVEESVSLPFSHLQFFAVATRNGGASAYLKVLAADGTVSQAPFLLREQSLSASLSGAPPRIAEKLEALRAREDVRLSTRSLIARGLEDPVVGILGPAGRLPSSTSNRAVQAQSLLTIPGLLGFVGQNLANKVLNDAENSFYTWVAQSLGWHYGTAQTLNDISVQLSGALQGIATISSDLKTGQLNTLFSQLSNDIDNINAFYTSLFNGANSVNSTYFSQPSSTVPTDVQSFLNGSPMTLLRKILRAIWGTSKKG